MIDNIECFKYLKDDDQNPLLVNVECTKLHKGGWCVSVMDTNNGDYCWTQKFGSEVLAFECFFELLAKKWLTSQLLKDEGFTCQPKSD